MRKLLVALSLIAMTTSAVAQHRHDYNRRYNPPQHHHNRGINPWVAGAIGLGVLGAGTYYYNQRRICWNEPVMDPYGRQVYDQFGRPLIQQICE